MENKEILKATHEGSLKLGETTLDVAVLEDGTRVITQSEILVRSLAQLGITALVDEATGYQDVRVKDALQQIFDQLLLDEAKKYKVTFPLELYKQWFRLNDWQWKPENAQKRPGVIGKWTNKYIYERMAPGLLKENYR